MFEEYPIHMHDMQVGKINLKMEGLYYRYVGIINPKVSGIYRIYALTEKEEINLGVCQPIDGAWVTHGRIPYQKLNGNHNRYVVNPEKTESKMFLPVSMKISYEVLVNLNRCRFVIQNGNPGIIPNID